VTDFSISSPVALFTGAALFLVGLGLVALALDRRRVHRRLQRFQGMLEDLAYAHGSARHGVAPPRLPEHLAALTAKTERLLLELDDLKTEDDRRRFKDSLGRLHQHHRGLLLEIGGPR
jgi:hypothetical protein